MGCELLLVYLQGDSSVDNYNDGAILYWTLVGLWLVPGNTYEHLCVMQAILVDCRTGAVLGTATGEGRLSRLHAAAYQDITRGQLQREAPRKALADVQKSFAKTLADVVQAAQKDAKGKGPALTGWAQ
jgi:rhombotail lipoprotein